MVGLVLGVLLGAWISRTHPEYASYVKPFSDAFLRLIKMVIAPLIFATLVSGIAGAGHAKDVGRMGFKAIVYFEVVTTVALALGLLAVNITRPGDGITMPLSKPDVVVHSKSASEIVLHTIPTSVVQAMAEGDVLQIVFFSILFALALSAMKERGRPIVALCETLSETMFKMTAMVTRYAPIGVSAAIAYTIGHSGLGVLVNLCWLVGTLFAALVGFVLCVLLPIAWVCKVPVRAFFKAVKEPVLIAFSTSTSEAALPKAMEAIEHLGVPRKIVSFVMPLGYSFNLDGTSLYMALAAVFVAQVAHVELTISQQIAMMLTLMLTSKGVAGVPRASFVILAGTLASFGLPLEGLTLILGVDAVMDMGRTAVNVLGNCLATVVVARWEGAYPPKASDL